MADLSLRYNPTGEAVVTLVDEAGAQISDFKWKVIVMPRESDLLVQLRTTDETLGMEVTTCPLTETVEARSLAVAALQSQAVDAGYEVDGIRFGDEQEPLP